MASERALTEGIKIERIRLSDGTKDKGNRKLRETFELTFEQTSYLLAH